MTTQQLYSFILVYLAVLVVVALATRATSRRVAGALAGGVAFGVVATAIIALGERVGWWHMAITWEPYFLALFLIGVAISGAFLNLLTWRVARRFGGRGLAVVFVIAALLGPVRDRAYLARFPEWGAHAPGIAPILAISATYVIGFALGYGVMRWISGPAGEDRLARARAKLA